MSQQRDDEQGADRLGAAVARVYVTVDPPPPHLLVAASAALAWRDPDAALATLLMDSAVAGEAAGIRSGSAPPRLVSFAAGDLVVDVELTEVDGVVHLVGQVSRPVAAPVAIRHSDGTWTGTTDALGRFAAESLPLGPLRVTWGPAEPGGDTVIGPTILP
ncbi:hypothetical protein [Dactylosporangium salmoneum]|uniref:Carboxypeptidase regulatory-like domain-containing protein n=1 Tax=Dactylosporangium salmoneum TaxID=53361 RepID=A0ABN3I3W9_9ACTN